MSTPLLLRHPELRALYYIRGILRNRVSYMNDDRAIEILKAARDAGVTADELKEITVDCWGWSDWQFSVSEAIRAAKH